MEEEKVNQIVIHNLKFIIVIRKIVLIDDKRVVMRILKNLLYQKKLNKNAIFVLIV